MLMLRTIHSLVISFCTLACLLFLHLIKAFIWSKPPGCKLVSSLGSLLFFSYFITIFYLVSSLVSLVFVLVTWKMGRFSEEIHPLQYNNVIEHIFVKKHSMLNCQQLCVHQFFFYCFVIRSSMMSKF